MNLNKTIITYFFSAMGVFLFAKIYMLFGHGVTSLWMSNAYLYLLGLGAFVFISLKIFFPEIVLYKGYRLFCQTYNSGIAILINGMLLYGILEIAGGTSGYISWFFGVGIGLMAMGAVLFVKMKITRKVVLRST